MNEHLEALLALLLDWHEIARGYDREGHYVKVLYRGEAAKIFDDANVHRLHEEWQKERAKCDTSSATNAQESYTWKICCG